MCIGVIMTKQTKFCSGDMIPNGRSCGSNLAALVSFICPEGIYGGTEQKRKYIIMKYNLNVLD